MPFWRIRCHFCGSRQPHSKTVTQFQCSNCEAVNFLDGKGNIVDTPAAVAAHNAPTDTRPLSFTHSLPESLDHQRTNAFCRTCAQNQLLYNETLANYLPDESHPQYKQYEDAIPAYKKELEKRYPLVCKRCAPLAQTKINRADYYGMTQNARRLLSATRARAVFLLHELVYHAYGILNILQPNAISSGSELDEQSTTVLTPSVQDCVRRLRFSQPCQQVISNMIPLTVAVATGLLWYNPGIKAWYHHTQRIEAVNGQKNYFYLQIILLVVRSWAWLNLSNPETTAHLDKEQLIGLHGFVILFVVLTQLMANRSIRTIQWTMKGKIMPKPTDLDVLGEIAGPSPEHYTPKASEHDPWKYLRKPENSPLDINMLAPKPPKQPSLSRTPYFTQQPSPELSEDDFDFDAMETDDRPVMRSSQRAAYAAQQSQHDHHDVRTGIGFGGMTDEVFGLQTQMLQDEERKSIEQKQKLRFQPPARERSPFYGHLPAAPMSMERRLRNPVITPVEPQRLPLSQQKDFMSQMRAGVKPVQFPEKGTNFELKKSDWHLPGDMRETGLEDRFLNTFNLADPTPPGQQNKKGFFGFFR